MKVLFCSDALVIDGVTSFIFQMAVTLQAGGHQTAVLGRWAGEGFQSRLRENGVTVFERLSLTVGNDWFDKKAREFAPDILVTDSNRSFSLARRLKKVTGARIFTFFLDPPAETTHKKGRSIPEIARDSDAWFSIENPILEKLRSLNESIPKFLLRRPLEGIIKPTPFSGERDPFRVLCISRLSGFKSSGPFAIVRDSLRLLEQIPSLEIAFVGGGWRVIKLRLLALTANKKAGRQFINVVGTCNEPQPWYDWATVICAGSTAAAESILSNRPVIAFTYYWLGLVTPQNTDNALGTYFAQKATSHNVRDNPELISSEIVKLYREWNGSRLRTELEEVQEKVRPFFDSRETAVEFERIFGLVGGQPSR